MSGKNTLTETVEQTMAKKLGTMTQNIVMNGYRITGLPTTSVSSTEAISKAELYRAILASGGSGGGGSMSDLATMNSAIPITSDLDLSLTGNPGLYHLKIIDGTQNNHPVTLAQMTAADDDTRQDLTENLETYYSTTTETQALIDTAVGLGTSSAIASSAAALALEVTARIGGDAATLASANAAAVLGDSSIGVAIAAMETTLMGAVATEAVARGAADGANTLATASVATALAAAIVTLSAIDAQLESTKVSHTELDNQLIPYAISDDVDNLLSLKADQLTTYTKTETDSLIAAGGGGGGDTTQSLAEIAASNPSTSFVSLSAQKIVSLASGTLPTDAVNLGQITTLLASKRDTSSSLSVINTAASLTSTLDLKTSGQKVLVKTITDTSDGGQVVNKEYLDSTRLTAEHLTMQSTTLPATGTTVVGFNVLVQQTGSLGLITKAGSNITIKGGQSYQIMVRCSSLTTTNAVNTIVLQIQSSAGSSIVPGSDQLTIAPPSSTLTTSNGQAINIIYRPIADTTLRLQCITLTAVTGCVIDWSIIQMPTSYDVVQTVTMAATADFPIGSIIAWMSSSLLPIGWLRCDGSAFNPSTYPDLFAVLGVGTTPQMQGYFLRGANTSTTGPDAGRVVGTVQADVLGSHIHTGTTDLAGNHTHIFNRQTLQDVALFGTQNNVWQSSSTTQQTTSTSGAHTHALTINPTGGSETRPMNIAVIWLIRASIHVGETSKVVGVVPAAGDILMSNQFRVKGVLDPVDPQDLVTKAYYETHTASGQSLNTIANTYPTTGSVSLANNRLTLLSNAVASTDALPLGQADSKYASVNQSLSLFGAPTAALNVGAQRVTNLLAPTTVSCATTKAYVDAAIATRSITSHTHTGIADTNNHQLSFTSNQLRARDTSSLQGSQLSLDFNNWISNFQGTIALLDKDTGNIVTTWSPSCSWMQQPLVLCDSTANTNNAMIRSANLYLGDRGQTTSHTGLWINDQEGIAFLDTKVRIRSAGSLLLETSAMQMLNTDLTLSCTGASDTYSDLRLYGNPTSGSLFIKAQGDGVKSGRLMIQTTSEQPYDSSTVCQIGNSGSTGQALLHIDGKIKAYSIETLVPVSHHRFKKNITSCSNDDLSEVRMVSFHYDLDAIQGEEPGMLPWIDSAQQTGMILEDVPTRYHRDTQWSGIKTIDKDRLLWDLTAHVVDQRRVHAAQIASLTNRLESVESRLLTAGL